jgi:hypothetical protein
VATAVKKNSSWGVEIEDTEGTYKAPQATTSFVQTLTDGAELSPSKELLERNINTSSIGKTSPRTGMFQVQGTLPVEARANATVGAAPEFDALMQSAFGSRRQISTQTTTKASGNTATTLQIEDADISKFNVGDIVCVLMDDAYHVSPIVSKTTGAGTASITLLVAHPSGDMDDSVVIEKSTTYVLADSGHPSLSISKYIEGEVLEQATGCKVSSVSLENFTTGQIPSLSFGFEGLNFDASVTSIPYTPSYNTGLPPIVLDARAYLDGATIDINELTFSLENALAYKTSVNAENGRISSRATERTISGSFNPFKEDDDVDDFTKYKNNTPFSLFAYAKVPTSTEGEFDQIVAVYMPSCIITEFAEADQDGLLQNAISFSANRGSAGTTPEIYVSFI